MRPARLERATFCFVGKRSIRLSYGRKINTLQAARQRVCCLGKRFFALTKTLLYLLYFLIATRLLDERYPIFELETPLPLRYCPNEKLLILPYRLGLKPLGNSNSSSTKTSILTPASREYFNSTNSGGSLLPTS
jgi:hypothetical protein